MTFAEGTRFLFSLGNEVKTAKFGLERIGAVLTALGSPHRKGKFIHVAGTNGKGSTCALIESGLRAAGVRTGLYTSPHLLSPRERIQLAGEPVSEAQFTAALNEVHACSERLLADGAIDLHPTYFETVTAMAFLIFADSADWIVLETGLGGRLDATNVVQPTLAVITPIDFDHEHLLGNTIRAIASEKAGILKAGAPAVFAVQPEEAAAVLRARARELQVSSVEASAPPLEHLSINRWGSRFRLDNLDLECPLAGRHQVENARTAAVALTTLEIPPLAIEQGIRTTRWPGRLQRIAANPDTIVDGAHNPAGARALAAYVREFFAGEKRCLVFGAMRDKSIGEMVDLLFPLFDHVIVTAPDEGRSVSPESLLGATDHASVEAAPNLRAARSLIPQDASAVFLTGSLFLVAEALALWPDHKELAREAPK